MRHLAVTQWVELFQLIGLSDQQMETWHQLFEKKYPDAHESFLTWLGMDKEKIAFIRKKYHS